MHTSTDIDGMPVYSHWMMNQVEPEHIMRRFEAQGFNTDGAEVVTCMETRNSGTSRRQYGQLSWGIAVAGKLAYVTTVTNRKGYPVHFHDCDSLLCNACRIVKLN